jgi:hypothetical protein
MKYTLIFFTSSLLILSGCDTVRDTFGLNHSAPDEFKVSENPPLSMPRDYALRPPAEGTDVPGTAALNYNASKEAQKTLLGHAPASSADTHTTAISSEKSLLSHAQAEQKTDPNIRQIVNEEAKTDSSSDISGKLSKMGDKIKENATDFGDKTPPSGGTKDVAKAS